MPTDTSISENWLIALTELDREDVQARALAQGVETSIRPVDIQSDRKRPQGDRTWIRARLLGDVPAQPLYPAQPPHRRRTSLPCQLRV